MMWKGYSAVFSQIFNSNFLKPRKEEHGCFVLLSKSGRRGRVHLLSQWMRLSTLLLSEVLHEPISQHGQNGYRLWSRRLHNHVIWSFCSRKNFRTSMWIIICWTDVLDATLQERGLKICLIFLLNMRHRLGKNICPSRHNHEFFSNVHGSRPIT